MYEQYREQIDAYIDSKKEEMIRDLESLVRIDSVKGPAREGKPFGEGPAKAVDTAAALMRQYGLKVTDYDHYVITGDYGDGKKGLDILAHLDVVPVSDEWTVTKPFEPKIVDGRIYGRGTADDKGPAVASIYAIRALKELNIPLKKSVRLVLGSDEECGSSDLEHYYHIEKEAPYSFSPDADFPVLNLEKARLAKKMHAVTGKIPEQASGLRVLRIDAGSKVNVVPAKASAKVAGVTRGQLDEACREAQKRTGAAFTVSEVPSQESVYDIEVKGLSAHGSTPELGCNALTALLDLFAHMALCESGTSDVILGLSRLWPHGDTTGQALGVAMSDEKSGALSMNLGILHYADGVLDGEFDVRAPLCATNENLTEVIRGRLSAIGVTMEEGNMNPAHYVPEDSPLVRTLLRVYEAYTGEPGRCIAMGGGTYVHDLKNGVAFGCMFEDVDNHMHGDDEFMVLDVLFMSAKMFASAIVELCG